MLFLRDLVLIVIGGFCLSFKCLTVSSFGTAIVTVLIESAWLEPAEHGADTVDKVLGPRVFLWMLQCGMEIPPSDGASES